MPDSEEGRGVDEERRVLPADRVAAPDLPGRREIVQPSEHPPGNGPSAPSPEPALRRSAGSRAPASPSIAHESNDSECACGGGTGCTCGAASSKEVAQRVFALGQLGYDFGAEARRDSIQQHMKQPANPHDPGELLAYLEDNPWDAAEIHWTLNLDQTPIYSVVPVGPFASRISERLRQFLREQVEEGVERVSIPGTIVGSTRLLTGQVVPAIQPALRGMYSWTTEALVKAADGKGKAANGKGERVGNFLLRVYHELRNLGLLPQERAINYAATNALLVSQIFETAVGDGMELDEIGVERSPICRPEADCWDVKLVFFDPSKVFERARRVFRFTVEVSDVVPVMVGEPRAWSIR